MATNSVVRARIDERVKVRASLVLRAMGLTVSDAFRLLLIKVAEENKFPFEIHVPNAETRAAILAADRGEGKTFSSVDDLFSDLGIKK
jgi:DNA-damage-inducible protein J